MMFLIDQIFNTLRICFTNIKFRESINKFLKINLLNKGSF